MNRTLTVLCLAALLALLAALLGTGEAPPSKAPGASPRTLDLPTGTPPPAPVAGTAEVGGIRLRAQPSHPYVTTGATEAFLVVSLEAEASALQPHRPLRLALVLDRSASMAGQRLRHARKAARQLIHGLSESDHLAIVHYGSEAVALPALRADAEGRAKMLAFVDAIEAEGGTNLGEALELAGDAVGNHPGALQRVLLISDGQPTVGEVEPEALVAIADTLRRRGFTLNALGVGEDFNEELLGALARVGDGTYEFLRDGAALPQRVIHHHAQAARAVAASLRIALTPGPHVELLEVLGHPLERRGPTSHLRLPGLAAGQTTHFVARVRIHADGREDPLDLAALELEVHEAGTGQVRSAQTMVRAHHTPDPRVAASHRQAGLTLTVARALAARNAVLAAEALEAYRPADARAHLDDSRALLTALTSSRADLPPPGTEALRLLEDELRRQEAEVEAGSVSGGGPAASGSIKTLKLAAQRGFGFQGDRP